MLHRVIQVFGARVLRGMALAAIVGMAVGISPAGAQEIGDAKFTFPASPAAWINSPPLTTEMLAGKGAFLWYFEEGCPSCRARWPAMFEAAKKFEGQPIVFIAVNSGNSRAEIQQYAREVGLMWPVIVDPDRSFEKLSNVNEISLQNIYQSRLLMADGTLVGGSFDLAESAPRALAGAKWRVDPKEVPDSLKGAWQQIEFGSFLNSAAQLKKSSNSTKPDEKAAAEKLLAAVQTELDKDLAEAQTKYDAGDKWQAYKAYNRLAARFKGYELPSDVPTRVKELATDETVRLELAASKLLESALRQGGPAGLQTLKRLTKQYPETESGRAAQGILDKAAG